MTDTATNKQTRRVLIALDAMQDDLGALETAIALAAQRESELMMLFIEDMNLVNLAGLPFASEIDSSSVKERKLDSMQMTRSFRTQAQRLIRQLEQMTRQKNVSYSFRTVRGHYIQEALSAIDIMDVLFMCRTVGKYGRHSSEQKLSRKKPASHHHVSPNAIWLMYNDNAAFERGVALASDIAATAQRDLVVILNGDDEKLFEVKQQVSRYGNQAIAINYFCFAHQLDEDELIELLRSRQCKMLVLPSDAEAAEQPKADRFLQRLGIPVVIVR